MAKVLAALLFLLSVAFFLERGPYRALRDSRTGDFATIYAASRCWMQRENPYNPSAIAFELSRAGAPAALIREQERHVSAYPISVMPLAAVFARLPWTAANLTWCLLSLGLFAASIIVLSQVFVSVSGKFAAASCCLFFCPTYVGVLNGNPSVAAISLTILSLYFARLNRHWLSGILFAITICVKPQIALCSLLAWLLWRRWLPLFTGLAAAAIITIFAGLWISSFGQNWEWWASLRQNAASLALPGGLVDPRPSSPYADGFLNAQTLAYLLTVHSALAEGMVLVLTVGIVAFYFYCSRQRERTADGWIDSAFFAAITLEAAYHRYYDGQLLLVLIPAIARLWQTGRVKISVALGICLALVAFPSQSVFAKAFEPAAAHLSLAQILLFRHQPAAVLAIAFILCCWRGTKT
jgi:hypothetical protein